MLKQQNEIQFKTRHQRNYQFTPNYSSVFIKQRNPQFKVCLFGFFLSDKAEKMRTLGYSGSSICEKKHIKATVLHIVLSIFKLSKHMLTINYVLTIVCRENYIAICNYETASYSTVVPKSFSLASS